MIARNRIFGMIWKNKTTKMYAAIRNRIATGHLKIGCFLTLVTKKLLFLTIYWVWLSYQFSWHNCDNYPLNEFSAHKRPLDSLGNFSSISEHGSLYKSEAIKHLEKYSLLKKCWEHLRPCTKCTGQLFGADYLSFYLSLFIFFKKIEFKPIPSLPGGWGV